MKELFPSSFFFDFIKYIWAKFTKNKANRAEIFQNVIKKQSIIVRLIEQSNYEAPFKKPQTNP